MLRTDDNLPIIDAIYNSKEGSFDPGRLPRLNPRRGTFLAGFLAVSAAVTGIAIAIHNSRQPAALEFQGISEKSICEAIKHPHGFAPVYRLGVTLHILQPASAQQMKKCGLQ